MDRRACLAACLAVVLAPGVASGCWIDNSVWESRVADADLLGVLECVTAGVDVGRYRLVESWLESGNGEVAVGEELVLGERGLHLVGDRLLIVSKRSRPWLFPDEPVDYQGWASTWGARTPLGGRALRTDRNVSLESVRLPLPVTDEPLRELRSPHRTLAELEAAVRELLALEEPERELRVLKALARRHMARDPLLARILDAESVERLVHLVTQRRGPVESVLCMGGRAATLAVLEALTGHDEATVQIRNRLRRPDDASPPAPPQRRDAGAAVRQLAEVEARLDEQASMPRRPSRGDPGRLAARIASGAWEDPYWLASTFCLICPEDRVHHLRTLVGARELWVRVTGAVYLAFESEAEGLRALEDLTRLPGDPGAWAALTLARRGVTSAVPRLLQAFGRPADDAGMQVQLRQQARALLSNAAVQAGVAQPPRLDTWNEETERAYRSWWEERQGALRPHDPWFEELKAQKID